MKSDTRYRIIGLLEVIVGNVLPLLFWGLIMFGFDAPYVAILTIIAAIIHEMGHSLAILALTSDGYAPSAHISGFRIRRRSTLSYRGEIIILAMGPLFNIVTFICSLPFGGAMNGYVRIFGLISLITALSNLLPIEGYDGYGILNQMFTSRNMSRASRCLETGSFLISVVLTFLSLYLIGKFGSGYWIFGVFFFMMTSKLIKFGKFTIFRE